MIQIQPVVFPLNLGTANQVTITLSSDPSTPGGNISYSILEVSDSQIKRLSSGVFNLTEEEFVAHGNDKDWCINYVVERLEVTLL